MKKYAPLLFLLFLWGCPREPPEPSGPLFDIPSLIGKTQVEIVKQLGTPPVTNSWQKGGTKLTAQFSQSGLLTSFLMESETPLKDEKREDFLKRGNLKGDDAHYQLSFVEAPDKVFYFTGVQVQLPSTHEVEFRIEGPEAMMDVSANGEEFMTIPPWDNNEKKLQASIGQQIVLAAALLPQKGKVPPATPIKLQIVVDGRVLKEESKPYEARCELVL
jgi:hypothetical protein